MRHKGFAIGADVRVGASISRDVIECEIVAEREGEIVLEAFGVLYPIKLAVGVNKLKFNKTPEGV